MKIYLIFEDEYHYSFGMSSIFLQACYKRETAEELKLSYELDGGDYRIEEVEVI